MTSTQKWALALTSVSSFMIALDSTIVATALTTIRRDLGASVETLEWTVNACLGYPQLLVPLIIGGCGISMAMPAAQRAVVGAVEAGEIGQASGTFSMLRQLGGVFGIAILASVFGATGGFGSPQAFTAGFVPAMGVAAALALAGAIAALAMPGRRAVVPAVIPAALTLPVPARHAG